MSENNKDFEKDYDSMKDVIEFQNNMFNPGHYIGTGKVAPTVSAPGNAAPSSAILHTITKNRFKSTFNIPAIIRYVSGRFVSPFALSTPFPKLKIPSAGIPSA